MASKGQKFKKYSSELKDEILKKYFDDHIGYKTLAKQYGIPGGTVWNWIAKTKIDIDARIDRRPGRSGKFTKKKNLTLEDYKERYEILKKYQAFLQARRGKK